jgi:hypothetical protein
MLEETGDFCRRFFCGTAMTGFWFSLGLCVVLLIPEPATFALLVFAAACLVLSPLASFWKVANRGHMPVETSAEPFEAVMNFE